MDNELELTVALQEYDHVRDLSSGAIRTPGLNLNFVTMPVPEMFGRFVAHREWEVSELGLGKYTALKAQGDDSLTAIPVFPARAFRHSAFYVPASSPLRRIEELAGLRVGIPEWAQTAVTYARGVMMDYAGVALSSIHWIQAGVNEPGRREKVGLHLPEGVVLEPRLDTSLDELLRTGGVDAVISAQPPAAFVVGDGSVRRLFDDPLPLEEAYFRETGIYPIMHVVAIRADVLDRHPWVAGNLLSAFEEAKRRSLARVADSMIPRFPLPWANLRAEQARALFAGDYWPYGLEANRTTLSAFLRYAFHQGVAGRLITPEDLFTPTTHAAFRI
ncbi:MAG: 4,5-dihydroxyphthalate decarboxylase [Candidatus Limnocylindrales bacterium]